MGWIQNDGVAPFQFDGYTILSDSGLLPADVQGIWDNAFTDGFPDVIGLSMMECLKWAEMSTTANNYSEVTMEPKPATLQPGGCIMLGGGFVGTIPDYTFVYVDSTIPASYEGSLIPEPATLTLLVLGGLAVLRRRSQ